MLTMQSLKASRLFLLQGVFILLAHLEKLRHWVVSWSVRTSAAGQGATSFSSPVSTSVPLSLTGSLRLPHLFLPGWGTDVIFPHFCLITFLQWHPAEQSSSLQSSLSHFDHGCGSAQKTFLLQSSAPHCPDATHSSTHPQSIEKAVSRGLYASARKDNY